ncbi:hypothetical protein Tco_0631887 [Tanacetum coccineum]
MGIVPIEMELVLEQTQQDTSHELSVEIESIHMLSATPKLLSGIKDSHHGPVMHAQPLSATQGLSTDSCFISHGYYMHFYRLSQSELVGIEKVAVRSSLRLL